MAISREAGCPSRWLPLSGAAFVAIVVVTFAAVAGDTPESGASAAEVASFYDAHQDAQWAAAFLLAAAAPLLVFFGVNLALALWPEAGRRPVWPTVLMLGCALGAMSFLVGAHGALAVADGADHLTPETLQGINVLGSDSWIVFNSALGIMLLGAAGSLIPRGARALGWPALVLGIALFIPFADFVALLLTGIWIIVTSILQLRGSASLASTS